MEIEKLNTAIEIRERINQLKRLDEYIKAICTNGYLTVEIQTRAYGAKHRNGHTITTDIKGLNTEDSLSIFGAIEFRIETLEKEFKNL